MEAEEKSWQWSRKKLGKNKRKMPTECRILRATPCEIEKSCEKRPARAGRRGRNSGQAARLKCSEFMEYTALFSSSFFSTESKLNKIQRRRWRQWRRRPMQSWPPQPAARKLARSEVPARRFVCRAVLHTVCKWQWAWRRDGGGECSECLGISLLNRQMLLQVKRNQIDK